MAPRPTTAGSDDGRGRPARWLRHVWATQPRITLALRAALAAALAWALVGLVPGLAEDYPYYAPFGAVVATTFTLAGSVRESAQSVGAIVLGGAVAWTVDAVTPGSAPLTVGIVVALSVLVAGWRALGPMGGWVPTAAIFTLIIGRGEAFFVGAYAGLTLFGALVGIGINALLPPVPYGPAQAAVDRTRRLVGDELRELAGYLGTGPMPSPEEWRRAHTELGRARAEMHTAVAQLEESRVGNIRAPRYRDRALSLVEEAEALDRLTLLAADVSDLLLRWHDVPGAPEEVGELPARVREAVAGAMEQLVDVLDGKDGGDPLAARQAVDAELGELLLPATDENTSWGERLVVDSVVLSLRRALGTRGTLT